MALYSVRYHFDGYKDFEIEADSAEEAERKTGDMASDVDCGELYNIEYDVWDTLNEEVLI